MSIHIGIVGPGIMPIPPVGWGGVEILIWDYAKTLESLGFISKIYNDVNDISENTIIVIPNGANSSLFKYHIDLFTS